MSTQYVLLFEDAKWHYNKEVRQAISEALCDLGIGYRLGFNPDDDWVVDDHLRKAASLAANREVPDAEVFGVIRGHIQCSINYMFMDKHSMSGPRLLLCHDSG